MRIWKRWSELLLGVSLAVGASAPASAALIVTNLGGVTNANVTDTQFQGNYGGFKFTPTVAVTLTQFGFYDFGPEGSSGGGAVGNKDDGFVGTITVSLYDTTPPFNLLATATLPAGTVAPLTNDGGAFSARFVSIAPYTLTAGHQYAIVGGATTPTANGNNPVAYSASATIAPQIQFDGASYNGSGLGYPGTPTGQDYGYLGATFQFTLVPEPAVCPMLGLAAFTFARRRRR